MPQEGSVTDGREQTPHHVGDEVTYGVLLDPVQRGHLDGPRLANASEVVAHQIDDHHVLGAVLHRARQLGWVGVSRGCALDWRGEYRAAVSPQEELRGEAGDLCVRPP